MQQLYQNRDAPFTLKVYYFLSTMHEFKSQKVKSCSFSSKADI